VINAQGKLSLELAGSSSGLTQRLLLEKEGVHVNAAGRVSLEQYGWRVREPASRAKRRSAI
jgi:alkylated DNA nucleotide flippase Atl1